VTNAQTYDSSLIQPSSLLDQLGVHIRGFDHLGKVEHQGDVVVLVSQG